ncbi:hypothetical protein CY34DRAFT_810376 [Suillus luteus UH-Slu-Lm8-n1]|uniref:Uncharacterized protein n=1 Tax=Suillus luteus UH-Slu-Lm8-n1 TaxID=930992 RepID=A0A0C9ZIY7_9AGAM|nr:hypothetical protein CY34DRAFT_810376 [Suillus luteus UH-Slu-Lm8-n1]
MALGKLCSMAAAKSSCGDSYVKNVGWTTCSKRVYSLIVVQSTVLEGSSITGSEVNEALSKREVGRHVAKGTSVTCRPLYRSRGAEHHWL